jgi:hypothetical protein
LIRSHDLGCNPLSCDWHLQLTNSSVRLMKWTREVHESSRWAKALLSETVKLTFTIYTAELSERICTQVQCLTRWCKTKPLQLWAYIPVNQEKVKQQLL